MPIHVKLSVLAIFVFITIRGLSQKPMSFEERPFPDFNLKDSAVFNFCSGQLIYQKLSKEEKEFYYWVNYSRNNPKKFFDSVVVPIVQIYPQLKGNYLTSLGVDLKGLNHLPLLSLNESLEKMAKDHSEDITSHNSPASHNSTSGETFSDRFKKYVFRKCGGENISYGANNTIFLLTLLYLDIDLPTLGHRKALLNANFTETGIGNSFYQNGLIFLVEDFACP